MSNLGEHEVVIRWPQPEAKTVILTGTFDKWAATWHLKKVPEGFEGSVRVPWGEKLAYKFIVDGKWRVLDDQPTERSPIGTINNVYTAPPKPDQRSRTKACPPVAATDSSGACPSLPEKSELPVAAVSSRRPEGHHDLEDLPPATMNGNQNGGAEADANNFSADDKPEAVTNGSALPQPISNFANNVVVRKEMFSTLEDVVSDTDAATNRSVQVDPTDTFQIAIPTQKLNGDAANGQAEACSSTAGPAAQAAYPTTNVLTVPVNAAENNVAAGANLSYAEAEKGARETDSPDSERSTHGPPIMVSTSKLIETEQTTLASTPEPRMTSSDHADDGHNAALPGVSREATLANSGTSDLSTEVLETDTTRTTVDSNFPSSSEVGNHSTAKSVDEVPESTLFAVLEEKVESGSDVQKPTRETAAAELYQNATIPRGTSPSNTAPPPVPKDSPAVETLARSAESGTAADDANTMLPDSSLTVETTYMPAESDPPVKQVLTGATPLTAASQASNDQTLKTDGDADKGTAQQKTTNSGGRLAMPAKEEPVCGSATKVSETEETQPAILTEPTRPSSESSGSPSTSKSSTVATRKKHSLYHKVKHFFRRDKEKEKK